MLYRIHVVVGVDNNQDQWHFIFVSARTGAPNIMKNFYWISSITLSYTFVSKETYWKKSLSSASTNPTMQEQMTLIKLLFT